MGFSSYKNESLDFIKARMRNYDNEFRRKARIAFERLSPKKRAQRDFDQLVGEHAGWIDMRVAPASNGRARKALRCRVIREVRRLGRTRPELEFIFGSIIHQPWTTTSETPLIDLADMQQRTRNVMNMCGFEGAIMVLEFQAEPGSRRSNRWPIHPNVHFIAWVEPGFNKRAAGMRVRSSKRLVPLENAKSLVLSKKMKAGPDLWRRCCYLIKEPSSGKKRHKVTGRFERTKQDMHPLACLRMTEILSYFRLSELTLLTGEATRLRGSFFQPIPARTLSGRLSDDANPSLARFWDRARSTDEHLYQPVAIVRKPKPPRGVC